MKKNKTKQIDTPFCKKQFRFNIINDNFVLNNKTVIMMSIYRNENKTTTTTEFSYCFTPHK